MYFIEHYCYFYYYDYYLLRHYPCNTERPFVIAGARYRTTRFSCYSQQLYYWLSNSTACARRGGKIGAIGSTQSSDAAATPFLPPQFGSNFQPQRNSSEPRLSLWQ